MAGKQYLKTNERRKVEQEMMQSKKSDSNRDPIELRLDALLRLVLEISKSKDALSESSAARIFKSVGLTPTEIARILGKKSATDVAQYLYKKSKTE